jgi:hypothetical protein
MSKMAMSMISFEAMKFGNENDLKIALTELKWIEKTEGKLTNNDFEAVSQKYKFPIGFLKKGLLGFSYPEDYLVSKSKWFPILYSWVVVEQQLSINLFKFQFDHLRTKFWSMIFLAILGSVLVQLGSTLQILFKLDWLQLLSVIVVPFAFFFVSISIELKNTVTNKKIKLDEYSAHLKETGFHRVIVSNERFVTRNFKNIAYAGNIVLKKLQSSPSASLLYVGWREEERTPSRSNRLLVKLRLLPKRSASVEKEKIPIFYAENPYIEYRKRIEELEKENR